MSRGGLNFNEMLDSYCYTRNSLEYLKITLAYVKIVS